MQRAGDAVLVETECIGAGVIRSMVGSSDEPRDGGQVPFRHRVSCWGWGGSSEYSRSSESGVLEIGS